MRTWHLLFSGLLIFATDLAAGAEWLQYRIDLHGRTMAVSLPRSESKDFPQQKIKTEIDADSKFDQHLLDIAIFEKYFDYSQPFTIGPVGVLHVSAMIRAGSPDDGLSALNSENLKQIIIKRSTQSAEKQKRELMQRGINQPARSPPTDFVIRSIGGSEWVEFRPSDRNDIDAFAIGIDPAHYVQYLFHFIDNSRGNKSDWHSRADVDVLRMVESTKFFFQKSNVRQ